MVYQRKQRAYEQEPLHIPQVQNDLFASPDVETEEADTPYVAPGPTAAPDWEAVQRQIDNPLFDFGKISILPPDSAVQRQPVDPSTLSKRERFIQRAFSVQREPIVPILSRPPGPLDHHFAAPREDGQAAPLAHPLAIQRQAKTADQGIAQSGTVNLTPQGSGRPLPKQVSDPFVQSGYPEVQQARVHVDDAATQSIQAKAYTQKNNIVVQSSGANDPKLLGHEATHVVQQSQMALKPDVNGTPINANPALEQNADDNGERVARHEPVNVKGASAQQPKTMVEVVQPKPSEQALGSNGIIQRAPTVREKKGSIKRLDQEQVIAKLTTNYPSSKGALHEASLKAWLEGWWPKQSPKSIIFLKDVYREAIASGEVFRASDDNTVIYDMMNEEKAEIDNDPNWQAPVAPLGNVQAPGDPGAAQNNVAVPAPNNPNLIPNAPVVPLNNVQAPVDFGDAQINFAIPAPNNPNLFPNAPVALLNNFQAPVDFGAAQIGFNANIPGPVQFPGKTAGLSQDELRQYGQPIDFGQAQIKGLKPEGKDEKADINHNNPLLDAPVATLNNVQAPVDFGAAQTNFNVKISVPVQFPGKTAALSQDGLRQHDQPQKIDFGPAQIKGLESEEKDDAKVLSQDKLKQHGQSQNTDSSNEEEKVVIDDFHDKEEKVGINNKKHNKKKDFDHRIYTHPKEERKKMAGFTDAKKKIFEAMKLPEMKAYLQHIPLEELGAINNYQGPNNKGMNINLREEDGKDPQVLQATSALNQLPPVKGTVYRGITASFSKLEDWGYLDVDDEYTEKPFLSTTIDRRYWAKSDFSDGRTGFQIESEGGAKDIRGFARSNYENEDELIFTPGTKFKIEGITPWPELITDANKDNIPKSPNCEEKVNAEDLEEKYQAEAVVIYLHEVPSDEQKDMYQKLEDKYGTINISKATEMSLLMSAIEHGMYRKAGIDDKHYNAYETNDEQFYFNEDPLPSSKIKYSFFVNVLSAIKQISQDNNLTDKVIGRLQTGSVDGLKELALEDEKVETLLKRWQTHMEFAEEFIQFEQKEARKLKKEAEEKEIKAQEAIKTYNSLLDKLLQHKKVNGNQKVIDKVENYLKTAVIDISANPLRARKDGIKKLLDAEFGIKPPMGLIGKIITGFGEIKKFER